MSTTTSKNDSFTCVEGVGDNLTIRCPEDQAYAKQDLRPLQRFLRDLGMQMLLFLGTDRWEGIVSLKMGDSLYMMRMDDIQNRWRQGHE